MPKTAVKNTNSESETEKKFECHVTEQELADILERDIVQKNLNIHWNDIADLEEAKSLLHEAMVLPIWMPNYFKGMCFSPFLFPHIRNTCRK